MVENRYAERVDGLWYLMGIFTRGEDLASVPERKLQSLNVLLEPGETKKLEFEADGETLYASPHGSDNLCPGVHVAAMKLGGAVVVPAERW
jgi:hypothetical protein